MTGFRKITYLKILLGIYSLLFIWSLILPFGYLLWALEVAPAIIGILYFVISYRKIEFSNATYTWFFIAACLMTIGAHYSYSQVPLFNWIKDFFNWNRNNYDKIGHLVQGLVTVLISREILILKVRVRNVSYINILSFAVAMAISGGYEIIEWATVFFDSHAATDFLGAQGYIWDTQTDMLIATIGALLVLIFGRRNLKRVLNLNTN
ncbi:DUF2238 domain-containing protein [uncultured Draconibacterium sp.]|uniref:DUF2238 domain-containing protein n=1 Tax=uncultured Draconibacterium sp. TaxID=1573823 RepID=UPI0032165977